MKDIFINIKNKTRQVAISNEVLGIVGENCQGNFVVDFAGDFIDGVGWLETQCGDTKGYIVLEKDSTNKTYSVPIKSCLLTKAGEMEFQIRITQNKVADEVPIFKSDIFKLLVLDSINAVEEIPDKYPDWLEVATAEIEELSSKVDTLDEDLQSEISNRQTADETLQNNITEEATERQNADNSLQTQITANSGAISTEKTARESADQTLQSNINNKVDKVAGKDLSTNDFTNDYKTQVENNTTARHSHTNKALLDTYDQTNANIKDAVTKKHSHSNKEVLDNTTASYTTEEKTKLGGIETGAKKNVQSDWTQTDPTADDYIRNKPTIPSGLNLYNTTGQNTDGAMTQKATTDELAKKTNASELLDKTYPVGAIYISVVNTSPASLFGGTWAKFAEGYTLWTASSGAGEKISAGLPNIVGTIENRQYGATDGSGALFLPTGAISYDPNGGTQTYTTTYDYQSKNRKTSLMTFDASQNGTDPIYGKSTTVQPPAIKVYMWKRVADGGASNPEK